MTQCFACRQPLAPGTAVCPYCGAAQAYAPQPQAAWPHQGQPYPPVPNQPYAYPPVAPAAAPTPGPGYYAPAGMPQVPPQPVPVAPAPAVVYAPPPTQANWPPHNDTAYPAATLLPQGLAGAPPCVPAGAPAELHYLRNRADRFISANQFQAGIVSLTNYRLAFFRLSTAQRVLYGAFDELAEGSFQFDIALSRVVAVEEETDYWRFVVLVTEDGARVRLFFDRHDDWLAAIRCVVQPYLAARGTTPHAGKVQPANDDAPATPATEATNVPVAEDNSTTGHMPSTTPSPGMSAADEAVPQAAEAAIAPPAPSEPAKEGEPLPSGELSEPKPW